MKKEVIVITKPKCVNCDKVKEVLDSENINYTTVNGILPMCTKYVAKFPDKYNVGFPMVGLFIDDEFKIGFTGMSKMSLNSLIKEYNKKEDK